MAKVEKTPDNVKKCFCPTCPSYNECAKSKGELIFCAVSAGKSECPFPMNGCHCLGCPVYQENNLRSNYYCVNGAADQADSQNTMM